jgi:hypothetical protein
VRRSGCSVRSYHSTTIYQGRRCVPRPLATIAPATRPASPRSVTIVPISLTCPFPFVPIRSCETNPLSPPTSNCETPAVVAAGTHVQRSIGTTVDPHEGAREGLESSHRTANLSTNPRPDRLSAPPSQITPHTTKRGSHMRQQRGKIASKRGGVVDRVIGFRRATGVGGRPGTDRFYQ